MLGTLRSRLVTAVAQGELPASTDLDGLSRFYLTVYQGMAIQARDGATEAELKSIATAAMAAWPSNGPGQRASFGARVRGPAYQSVDT